MLSLVENRGAIGAPGLLTQSIPGCGAHGTRTFCLCKVIAASGTGPHSAPNHRFDIDTNHVLFSQDEAIDAIFVVADGVLRLSRLLPDARRHVTGFALSGDVLGLAADSFGMTAEALTRVTVCRLERSTFLGLAADNPSLLGEIQAQAARDLAMARHQMMLLGRGTAEEKVAGFLVGMRQRYARLGLASTTLELPMKRQDIADHLGLTTETVCRMLTRLEREKIILLVPGGVRVLARTRLERLALI